MITTITPRNTSFCADNKTINGDGEYRDPLMRWPLRGAAFTNEVGEALRPIIGEYATLSWVPALMYIGADVYDKYKNNNTEYNTESNKNSIEYSSVKVYNTENTQQQESVNNENITTAKEKTTSSTKKVTNPILTRNKNEKYIVESIKENGVKKTIEKLGHIEVIEAILDNQSLKYLLPQLATVIKTYDLSSLKKITQDCSDAAFVYICGIVNSDFIQELKDNRGHLCYAATKQLEKMEENYATC